MNELKIFSNTEFGKLSVNNTDNGIYFFLGEVCRCLGYTKQAKGNTYLRKDKIENICESLEIKGLSPSDNFETITLDTDFDNTRITEDALYDLILESKAKNARKFRKWVTSDVLPKIRRTGGYIPVDEGDSEKDILAKALLIANKTISELQQSYDDLMNTEGLYHMNTVAKELKIGRNTLFAYLRGKDIMFYQDNSNVPYQRFMNQGLFRVVESPCADGKYRPTTYATKKGLEYIRKILRKDGYYNAEVTV